MYMSNFKWIFLLGFILAFPSYYSSLNAQTKVMNLNECIEYAKEHNINVKKAKLNYEESQINTLESKASLYPNLSFSSGQNFSYYSTAQSPTMDKGAYNGNYGLNSSMTLYNGGRLLKGIEQSKLQQEINKLNITNAEYSITVSIIQNYIQILYANESVKNQEAILNLSKKQLERSNTLLKAGSISKADLAQLESQKYAYDYQLIQAKNSLQKYKLDLKQLLELKDDIDILTPSIDDSEVVATIQSLEDVYNNSYNYFISILNGKKNIELASLSKEIAKTGYYPSLSLNAGISTGHNSQVDMNIVKQLKTGLYENIGLNLSVPIYSRRQNKSSIQRADISIKQSELDFAQAEKNAWKIIETLYLDALNNQNSFITAKAKVSSQEISYQLVEEKFNLGLKNTIEILSEQNNLLLAKQEMLQAKYQTMMSKQLMNFYQQKPLEIKY